MAAVCVNALVRICAGGGQRWSVQDREETSPVHLGALTATNLVYSIKKPLSPELRRIRKQCFPTAGSGCQIASDFCARCLSLSATTLRRRWRPRVLHPYPDARFAGLGESTVPTATYFLRIVCGG